jgi:hypothetical protein
MVNEVHIVATNYRSEVQKFARKVARRRAQEGPVMTTEFERRSVQREVGRALPKLRQLSPADLAKLAVVLRARVVGTDEEQQR